MKEITLQLSSQLSENVKALLKELDEGGFIRNGKLIYDEKKHEDALKLLFDKHHVPMN